MAEENKTYRIFVSAAEPSADSHCAGLIEALRETGRNFEFVGVGGPKMAEAGCKLLADIAGKAVMTYKAFGQVGRYYMLIRRISSFLKKNEVDLVIVCDSPAFNFHIARVAKKAGVKTLFYVAPQLWAWAPWRIAKLRKYCDKLACILPFEQEWFKSRGVEAEFVGNPLLDGLDDDLAQNKKTYSDFEQQAVTIALMPGSRMAEIDALWRPMQQIIARLRRRFRNLSVTAVAVDEQGKEILRTRQLIGFRCKYAIGGVFEAAKEADFAIVASGSATLQVAAAGCPMVVMYQSSRVLWHLLGRWLIKMKYLSLVNILAKRQLVPEFMPYFGPVGPIAEKVQGLIESKEGLAQISGELVELAGALRTAKASENVARICLDMLG